MTTAEEVKAKLGPLLLSADRVVPPQGVPTGWSAFDHFVLWGGLPKGSLSLFRGVRGLGATTLWAQAAAQATQKKKWCAWVNAPEVDLCPWALRRLRLDFRYFMVVGAPRHNEEWLWSLQEILSLSLFELIACDVGRLQLRAHQLVKLKTLVSRSQCALVLLSSHSQSYPTTTFALVMDFMLSEVRLSRALHRPTPFVLPRRDTYADLMPQLAQSRTARSGRDLPHL